MNRGLLGSAGLLTDVQWFSFDPMETRDGIANLVSSDYDGTFMVTTGQHFWVKPAWAVSNPHALVRVTVCSGGGGGGQGRLTNTGFTATGGGGGGGGGLCIVEFAAGDLPGRVSVQVGFGGNGHVDNTTMNASGAAGGTGGHSGFGLIAKDFSGIGGSLNQSESGSSSVGYLVQAHGAFGGAGGRQLSGPGTSAGGVNGRSGMWPGGKGGDASNSASTAETGYSGGSGAGTVLNSTFLVRGGSAVPGGGAGRGVNGAASSTYGGRAGYAGFIEFHTHVFGAGIMPYPGNNQLDAGTSSASISRAPINSPGYSHGGGGGATNIDWTARGGRAWRGAGGGGGGSNTAVSAGGGGRGGHGFVHVVTIG